MDNPKLDREEQELIDSLEAGEWQSVPNVEQEIEKHVQYAKNTMDAEEVSLAGVKKGCRSTKMVVGGLVAGVMLFCVFPIVVMVLLLWLDPSTSELLSDVLTGLRATPLP